jgi:hypothetical protein
MADSQTTGKWTPVRETWQTVEESTLDNQQLSAANSRSMRMAEVESLANERKAKAGSIITASAQVSTVSSMSCLFLLVDFHRPQDIQVIIRSRRRCCGELIDAGLNCSH